AELAQRRLRGGVAQLRLVAEGEEGLLAAGGLALAGDVEDGLRREVVRLALARRARERAVVADIPAQLRQRDEHLLGEAHARAMTGAAKLFGQCGQSTEVLAFRQRHRLEGRQAPPVGGGRQRLSEG